MLEILLLILRIAGIIFVSVLGILIVVICFALFVPVRYRGDFSVSDGENGEKKKVCAVLRATWFLRLVRVYVTFGETVRLRVKVLFFTFLDTAKEKEDKGSNKGREKGKNRRGRDAKEASEIEDSRKASGAEQAKAADRNSGRKERDKVVAPVERRRNRRDGQQQCKYSCKRLRSDICDRHKVYRFHDGVEVAVCG